MRFFIDTEFIESGPMEPVQLISIGIATESGNDFYAVNKDFRESDASEWVRANVLPHLFPVELRWSLSVLREKVMAFVEKESARRKAGILGLLFGLRLGGVLSNLRGNDRSSEGMADVLPGSEAMV